MTPEQRILVAVLIGFLLIVVARLVHRQRIAVPVGVAWTVVLVGALALLGIPGLLDWLTALTRARFPVSAATLMALVVIVLFLLYVSIVLHRVESRQIALVRALALTELDLRKPDPADSREAGKKTTPSPP